ncbi:LysR family transcriptional regulator [Micromonospora sp. NPDC049559]|uniref:LysR family transcriptional regulator n=1 Tax=Micromonospora sp. NPDC049559 TaxID=3155923 RepID=UPI00341AB919
MDRLETRELTYFVAVAEELHFARAAARLGIAQPPLSRAIRQLERRLAVQLLERTSRRVSLTPAGEVLLREARTALDAVAAAGLRARRAGQPDPTLVLVTKAGADADLLPGILAEYAAGPDALPVEVRLCGIGEQANLLRQGHADVALLHRPYDDLSGIDTEELLTEAQVAVLPRGHRLAGRAGIHLADLRGETLPRWPVPLAPGAELLPEGETVPGPLVANGAQLLQLIALGRAVAVLGESARRHLRDDLVCVPVLDARPSTIVIGWPERSRSRAVAALVRAATAVAARRAAESGSRQPVADMSGYPENPPSLDTVESIP